MKKKKILFFIESFGQGGAENVLLSILKKFDYSKCDVTVLTLINEGFYKDMFYNLPLEVKNVFKRECKSIIEKIAYKLLYSKFPVSISSNLIIPKGYDAYIAFIEGFCTKIISSVKKGKKIAWVHADLSKEHWTIKENIFVNEEEEILTYKKYDNVVCVSKSIEDYFVSHYRLNNTKTIYNPILTNEIKKKSFEPLSIEIDKSRFNIIILGRLTKVKGIDKFLDILFNIVHRNLNINVFIVGMGEDYVLLNKKVDELGLRQYVKFTGPLFNPYPLLKQSDLLISTSISEGFSLVIAEAMVLGTPVLSMNCSGPKELLRNGEYGELCFSYADLERKIIRCIDDKRFYNELKIKAEKAKNIFDEGKMMCPIYDLLLK